MKSPLIGFFMMVSLAAPAAGQQTINFAGASWAIDGNVTGERYLGSEALRFRTGGAVLDTAFGDGTIEFDLATSGHRGFVGVMARVDEDAGVADYFYVRPHQSRRFDALQYTPEFHGMSAWQLYPEYNAEYSLPVDRWYHVKLVFGGERLEVFLDRSETPVMVVDPLPTGARTGQIVLVGNSPSLGGLAAPAELYTAAFANFMISPEVEFSGGRVSAEPLDPRFVSSWSLSPAGAIAASDLPLEEFPHDRYHAEGWVNASVDGRGRLNISETRDMPPGGGPELVLAHVVIESDRDQVKKLSYGFSDVGSIFLNEEVLVTANNTYLSRSGRYLGVMNIDNDAVFLPLRRGRNELVFAVAESFGGWGLTARFGDMDGIRVTAR